jgi:hypothetical protein
VSKRDDVVRAICERTGKTPEQAEAFLDILGSGLRRRGWIEGEPLAQDEIGEKLDTFIGQRLSSQGDETSE